jgi:hypothetical protein
VLCETALEVTLLASHQLFWIMELLALTAVLFITVPALFQRKGSQQFLCGDCRFNNPEDCHKTVRPRAMDCTAYRSLSGPGSDSYSQ